MKSLVVVYIFINFYLPKRCSCFDYCTIDCGKGPGQHTMCLYPESKSSNENRLEVDEKKKILELHNTLRQKVAQGKQDGQPPASDMMELKWDKELENIAQRWSDQKQFDHDKCRNSNTGEPVGQNLGMIKSDVITSNVDKMNQMVQSWYDEVAELDNKNVDSFNPSNFKTVGHYTQFVWSSTTKVGCGFTVYGDVMEKYLLVCNYKTTGNVIDKPMYQKGEACSNCSSNTFCSTKYPGLCTDNNLVDSVDDDDDNDYEEDDERTAHIFPLRTKGSAPFVRSCEAYCQVLIVLFIIDIFIFQ